MITGSRAGLAFDVYGHLGKHPLLGASLGVNSGYMGVRNKNKKL
jgi:hypothetical protein